VTTPERKPGLELKLKLPAIWPHVQRWPGLVWRGVRAVDVRKPVHAAVIGVTLASILAPVAAWMADNERYRVADTALVSNPSPYLSDKLTYDDSKRANLFNGGAVEPQNTMQMGAGGTGRESKQPYSATLPDQASQGIVVSDTTSGVGVTMTPQFGLMDGKARSGHVVYPLKDDPGQLVFTPKGNGLKEDILLTHSPGDRAQYDYALNVPDSLVAKILPDGGVGFYSGDQTLFGNMSFGSDKDREMVEKARRNAVKNFLMFEIPAPVVKQSPGAASAVKARFQMQGGVLSVIVHGLDKAKYPLSIDPTFVITTQSDFLLGRIEDNIKVTNNVDGELNRATITSGLIDSSGWQCTSGTATADCTTTVSLLPNAGNCATQTDYNFSLTAYNGFLYLAGGGNGGSTFSCYVPLNSNGTLGTWAATTTTFPTGRTGSVMVGYNGYIYVMGGEDANGGHQFTTVEYAPVTSTGDITATWLTGSAMTVGRAYFGAVVYNDYIYACAGATKKNNGTLVSSCELVNINANGSLGTWTTTGATSLTGASAARDRFSMVAYNNWLYIAGGFDGTNALSDVQLASIKSDNTMNSWSTTTALPGVRRSNGIAAEQGYLYLFGGCTAAPACSTSNDLATTVYAPIHADGTIGTWDTSASLTVARFYNGGASYNGYIYSIGGCVLEPANNNNCISGNEKGDSQYAHINQTPGDVIAPATAGNDGDTSNGQAVLAYNGYLYAAGGCQGTNCGTAIGTTRYAQINDDGSVGTWNAGGALPSSNLRFGGAMVGFGGRIYYLGGETSGGTAGQTNVYSATLSSGNPTWSAEANTFATGRYWLAATTWANYMYITGGQGTGGPFNTTEYTQIDSNGHPAAPANCVSNGGTLGGTNSAWCKIWTTTTSNNFTTARYGHAGIAYDGYLYVIAGYDGSNLLDTVYRSSINSADGYPGAFSNSGQTSLPANGTDTNIGHAFISAAIHNSVLYLFGGIRNGTNPASAVAYATVDSSGNVGSWTRSARTLGTARWGAGGTSYNGMLYTAGGCTSASTTCAAYLQSAEYAEVRNGGRGMNGVTAANTNPWTSQASPAVTARADFPLVAYNGFLYAVGGCSTYSSGVCSATGNLLTTIYKAAIGADGSVGTWATTTTALPEGRAGHGAAVYNGRLYIFGGVTAVSAGVYTYSNAVKYVSIASSGDITASFTTSGNTLPASIAFFGTTTANGFVYVVGGYDGSNRKSDISYATISTVDGSVASWSTTSSAFTTARQDLTAIAYNSNMYVIAGYDGTNTLGDIQYASLNASTGAPGTFKYTTYQDQKGRARQAVSGNGYMYFLGSENSVTDAFYADINANGTLGNLYRPSTGGMAASTNHAHGGAVFYNGFIYSVGGCTLSSGTCSTANATVEYVGQKANARIGHYSKLFDTQVDTAPAQITVQGTGQYSAIMRTAGSGSTTLGQAQVVNPMYAGVNYTLLALDGSGNNVGIASKYYIFLALDDSQTGAFPDTGSTATDIDITYHANPGRRLRHGASFTNTGCSGTAAATQGCVLDTAP
jgi:N-acetylneuraminic acid mutarotase